MKISWINDAGIRAETSNGLILFNFDENELNESSQKDENTIAIFSISRILLIHLALQNVYEFYFQSGK